MIERAEHQRLVKRLIANNPVVALLGARHSALDDLKLARIDVIHAGGEPFP